MSCVLFEGKGRRGRGEYGAVTRAKRNYLAHRLAYEDACGPIPEGYDVHHICDTKLCVNPEHLALVLHAQHRRTHHRIRTHCPRGHRLAGDNVYVYGSRAPDCRTCRSEAGKRRKEKVSCP